MDKINIVDAISTHAIEYPNTCKLMEEVLGLSPRLMRSQFEYQIEHHPTEFWPRAEKLVSLALALGGSPARSLIDYTVISLKAQAEFMNSGEYAQSDFEIARKEIYDNAEIMNKFYLEGLMLTHAFWPIHFDIHDFFMEHFVNAVPDRGCGAEFGFGHGLYMLEVLNAKPASQAKGFDISTYSIQYARKLLETGGISSDRFSLDFADVMQELPCKNGELNWAILAEVLEHIPNPEFAIAELRRCMAPEAPVFIATVVDGNAMDHLHNFESPKQIREMLCTAGFEVTSECNFAAADYTRSKNDPTLDVVCVCRPTT